MSDSGHDTMTSVRLSEELLDLLAERAEANDVTVSEQIRAYCRDQLNGDGEPSHGLSQRDD